MLFYLPYYIYNDEKHLARKAYLESRQRYMMEFFCEELKLFFQKNFIIDVWHGSKYASELQSNNNNNDVLSKRK